jgi:hypothetical protein
MSKKRKMVTMSLRVSAPAGMTAAQVRQEIRTRIVNLSGHYDAFALGLPDSAETGQGVLDLKVCGLAPAPRVDAVLLKIAKEHEATALYYARKAEAEGDNGGGFRLTANLTRAVIDKAERRS